MRKPNTVLERSTFSVKQINHSTTSLKIKEEFSLKNATAFGGANLLLDFIEHIKLKQIFKNNLRQEKHANAKYTVTDVSMVLSLGWILGKDRIFHFKDIEQDPLLTKRLQLEKLPDHTILYKDLERFRNTEDIFGLKLSNRDVTHCLTNEYQQTILDIDATVETLYGQQENANKGYNPKKPGRKSYHPLLAFEAQSKACINSQLRSGNCHSADKFIEFMNDTELLLGRKINYVRIDVGFSNERYFEFLEKITDGYVSKLKMTKRLRNHCKDLEYELVSDECDRIEIAEFYYQAVNWSKSYRVIIVRKLELADEQLLLFENDAWTYSAIVTNLDWNPIDIWHFYNQRCTCENHIKEMKAGFAIDQIASSHFYANYADLMYKTIAYNLFLAFQKYVAVGQFKKFTVERMRRYFFMIPAVIVSHARQVVLRLSENFLWQHEFWQMRQKLAAL